MACKTQALLPADAGQIAITPLLLAQDAHCNIENRRIVHRNDTPVRSRFEVHADAILRYVLAAKVIADSVYVDS